MKEEASEDPRVPADYRLRRSSLETSVEESEGYSVYDALVDQIDWEASQPWRDFLVQLNPSQRSLVALAQVHEHAAFNGLEEALLFHGREVLQMAAAAAVVVGEPGIQDMLLAALDGNRDWVSLEQEWDKTAGFEIEEFIESHAADFFIDE